MYLCNIFVLYPVKETSPVIIHLDVKQYHIPEAGFQSSIYLMHTSSSYALFFLSVNIYKMDIILVQAQCVLQWLYF